MSSGSEKITFNSLERLVSTDHNRLQSFVARDRAEAYRQIMSVSSGTDDLDAGGVATEFVTQENPLRAEVLNGLLVRPQVASLNVLVDAGILFAVDPDAVPVADDSVYKYVRSPGIPTVGALAMTANASGSIRIDVVECQRTGAVDQVAETDNRDLFNPTTGLFTATTLTKATQSTLTFRVRAGTPGGGFPGTAQGWLPLAVASVAAGATSCDQVTFWDVRRLMSDRLFSSYNLALSKPINRWSQWNATVLSAAAGIFEGALNTRRIGGRVRPGTVAVDAQAVDLTVAANRDPAFALVANRPWYLYALTPFALPRWARYTDAVSGTRVPRSPRGILVASTVAPDADGRSTGTVGLPTATGLAGSATITEVLCVAAGYADHTGAMRGFFGDEGGLYLSCNAGDIGAANGDPIQVTGSAANPSLVSLVANTHYPACARAILVDVEWRLASFGAGLNAGEFILGVFPPGVVGVAGAEVHARKLPLVNTDFGVGGTLFQLETQVWITLPAVYPTLTPPTRQDFSLSANFGATNSLAPKFRVVGWRF